MIANLQKTAVYSFTREEEAHKSTSKFRAFSQRELTSLNHSLRKLRATSVWIDFDPVSVQFTNKILISFFLG